MFDFLESNTTMYKVLGMALAIGNIMNGNTPKGRSDGFELDVLRKLNTTKDNCQRSMLQFIMKKLVEEDPTLPSTYREQNNIWKTRATDLDSVLKKFNDTSGKFLAAEAAYRSITESGEPQDNFMLQTGADMRSLKA